jgi:hypothetical protein
MSKLSRRALNFLAVCSAVLLASCATPSSGQSSETADDRIAAVLAHAIANPVERQEVTMHPVLRDQTFSRPYNVSRSARAYLQLMTDPSKDAESARLLDEVAQFYLDHPEEIPDPDSTYWAGEYHSAIMAKFGLNGSARPGVLPRNVERKMLDYMVAYVNQWSRLEHYDFSLTHQTYYYWNSENHWWQEIVTAWGYLLALKNDPDYAGIVLNDGRTVQAHYEANVEYMKEHMRQRARKGFFTEISSGGYAGRMHNMYFMINEISPDPELRRLARLSLDLWWTFWAEEQILGERGGGKVRHRGMRGLLPNTESHMTNAWYYHGTGNRDLARLRDADGGTALATEYIRLLSDYRPPAYVTEILQDRRSAPAYSVTQRRIGRSAGQDENGPPEILNEVRTIFDRESIPRYNFYDYENSGVLKYSWVSPNFVLGTNMRPPLDVREWTAGSAQSWWHGLLVRDPGTPYPQRVVPTVIYDRDSMGEQYAVQSRGSFMTRKLNDAWSPRQDNSRLPMGVYISDGLRRHTTVEGGFIFINSPTTWVAVRVAQGEFVPANQRLEPRHARAGTFYGLENETAPVIIEAAEHSEHRTFEAFKAAARAAALSHADGVYRYASLSGDVLSMFDDRSTPMINRTAIDYEPEVAYSSRYVFSDWDSGIIRVTVAGGEHVLNFMRPG